MILYSQLQAENTFSDFEKYIGKVNKLVLHPVDSLYDCLLLVEKNEIELSATAKDKYEKKAKVMIASMNDVMNQTTDNDIRFELLHHIGKLYMKLRDLDNAKIYFNQALDARPKEYATLLQLAKAFHSSRPSDTKKAKEYVAMIMDDFGKGIPVPLTIILACYSDFLSKKSYKDLAKKYIEDKFDDFARVIIDSLVTFANQAVPTLGTFAFSLAYKNPDFMRFALQALQEPPSIHSDRAYIQAYANLKAAEYKLEEDKKTDKAKAILVSAKEYYGLLKLEENEGKYPKDYIRKRYLELLMDAGELEDALQFSKYFDNKENSFYLQDMAKLCHKLEKYDKALDYIDKAIAGIADKGYKSSFMWNKANILHDMGDSSCITLLQEAIDMREADKAKGEWEKTIEVWASEF